MFGRWAFRDKETEHECPRCKFPLTKMWPSNMLVCHNPICDADPLFLVPKLEEMP